MKMSVRDLLKNDLPPTYSDGKMRRKHTLGSIEHQIKHFSDHGKAAVEQLEKLYTVDSAKARSEAARVIKEVDSIHESLESFINKCKGYKDSE